MPADHHAEFTPDQAEPSDQLGITSLLHTLRGAPSRRDVLRGLTSAGLSLGLAALPVLTEAKPKRRKKRKRLKLGKPNKYGCLEVNAVCRKHQQCCSGICTGKPGKKRCRAHGIGTCVQTNLGLCETSGVEQTLCNNSSTCACTRTTSGSSFCGSISTVASSCTTCKRDADCVNFGYPPGSACAPFATGVCAGLCPTAMVCMAPCGATPPVEM